MNLIILGCYGPYTPAGGACSGYLLEHEGRYILLDCGNGVLSKLQYHIKIESLDAVFISHLHSDHISDLFIMRYALQMDMELGRRNKPLKLFAPDEPASEFERLPYKDVFAVETLYEGKSVDLASLNFTFMKTVHPIDCCAIKVELGAGKTFLFSGDTVYFPELISFARNTSLFLCEANYLQEDLVKGAPPNHLSAFQAGEIAQKAGVQRLLLTHLPPHRECNMYLAEARMNFPDAALAEEGKVYAI